MTPGIPASPPAAPASRDRSQAPRGPLVVEVVRDLSAFLALRHDWNPLLRESPQAGNPMLTHEWFQAWLEGFGERKDLLILLLRAGERLVGIAPLMRYRSSYHGVPIRLLSLITNDHTNRADFILADRTGECLAAILRFLRAEASGWDMAELNFLPLDSPTVATFRERAGDFGLTCETKPSYESPFIPLTGDWDSFYARLDGHFRRNLRNREKRLAGLGRVEYEESQEGVRPLGVLLGEICDVGERSWKGAEKTAVASTPELRRFYTRLAALTAPAGGLSLHLLRVGGKPIAFHYSLKSDGAVYLLKTEYDTAYHPYSPGHQIQKRVLERCYAHGVREFDFLGPDMDWKREWSDRVRQHVRMLLFHRGTRSRVLALLERRIKPALKRSRLLQRVRANDIQD